MSSDETSVTLSEVNLKLTNDLSKSKEDDAFTSIVPSHKIVETENKDIVANKRAVLYSKGNRNVVKQNLRCAGSTGYTTTEKNFTERNKTDGVLSQGKCFTNECCSQLMNSNCCRSLTNILKSHWLLCLTIETVLVLVLLIVLIIVASGSSTCDTAFAEETNICDIISCLHQGSCSEINGNVTCLCKDGFGGDYCEESPCSEKYCLNRGECITSGSIGTCKCTDGFSGDNCNITPCTNISCNNGGSCTISGSSFKCSCPEGISGTFCNVTPCSYHTCPNGGTCVFSSGIPTCACPKMFYGEACEKKCEYGASFYGCTFEDEDEDCFLQNDIKDDFNWTRIKGSTPSFNTGPDSAYEGMYYLYAESSRPTLKGHVARLVSKEKYSTCIRCLRFSYHMYGVSVGKLNIYHGQNEVWSVSGNKGSLWKEAAFEIQGSVNKTIVVEAVRGDSVSGDIAIDNIWYIPGGCT